MKTFLSLRPARESRRFLPAGNLTFLFLFACLGGGFAECACAGEPSTFHLRPAVETDGTGIFAAPLFQSGPVLPVVRLADPPALGRTVVLTRAQIAELLAAAEAAPAITNWAGAEAVRVTRRARTLAETDVLALLAATLQAEHVKERGELEIRFPRPWTPVRVPDEPLTVKVLDLPPNGVTPACLLRFELRTATESVGTWQTSLQARVWREVWVARTTLKRGTPLPDADVGRDRRDVLGLRESPADFAAHEPMLELAESVQAGAILLARVVQPRPVIRRGQAVQARLEEGTLSVSLRVEALEDGAPGQRIRVRNATSRRDLNARVLDEQTVLVSL